MGINYKEFIIQVKKYFPNTTKKFKKIGFYNNNHNFFNFSQIYLYYLI